MKEVERLRRLGQNKWTSGVIKHKQGEKCCKKILNEWDMEEVEVKRGKMH